MRSVAESLAGRAAYLTLWPVIPIEVKTAERVTTGEARNLETFLDEYAELRPAGLLLYCGKDTFWLTRRVLAAPWWKVI